MIPDFHTHVPRPEGLELLSLPLEAFRASGAAESLRRGIYVSLELHPWYLTEPFAGLSTEWLEAARRVDAIGEVGLDRLRGVALAVQQEYLRQVLKVAYALRLPVVFHCVRCWPELLGAVKPYPELSKLLHGFRSGPKKLEEAYRNGFFVSMKAKYLAKPDIAEVARRYAVQTGLETDTDEAALENPEIPGFSRELLIENFFRFLKKEDFEMTDFKMVSVPEELVRIKELAKTIWRDTYKKILSPEQICYMIDWMYSPETMSREIAEGTKYYLICEDGEEVGYFSFGPTKEHSDALKLDKLYLDFRLHGRGIGSKALRFVIDEVGKTGVKNLYLNVNKHNERARKAYLRNGFEMTESVKNDIGNGFCMDDYVMRYCYNTKK